MSDDIRVGDRFAWKHGDHVQTVRVVEVRPSPHGGTVVRYLWEDGNHGIAAEDMFRDYFARSVEVNP